jgi:glycosyltransferase A (GT-A) superfamily protein (DUF2064 family)
MALTLIILADGPGVDMLTHLGKTAPALYASMLLDTVAVARQLSGARVIVRHTPALAPSNMAGLPAAVAVGPAAGVGAEAVSGALAEGLEHGGPALVIGGNLPHLPLWRLRDAATHLRAGSDLVIGPSDGGSWYILGLRVASAELLDLIPAGGATPAALAERAAMGHVVHLLPPWFGVDTVADLASLAESLRTMPAHIASNTRALIEAGQASRAVGG